jgi:hypothetical protein
MAQPVETPSGMVVPLLTKSAIGLSVVPLRPANVGSNVAASGVLLTGFGETALIVARRFERDIHKHL